MSINDYRDRGYAPIPKEEVAYEERLQCQPKMSRATMVGQPEIGPERESDYPSVQDIIGDTEKAIAGLNAQIGELSEQIKDILCEESPHTNPIPGPRVSNSPLTHQIAFLADKIDELSDKVYRIRCRVTL
jgi:archaellum component FlaC